MLFLTRNRFGVRRAAPVFKLFAVGKALHYNTGMTGKLSVMLGLCHHKKTLAQVELDGVRPEDIEWPPKVPVEWQGAVKNEMKKPEVSKRRTINAAYFNSQLSKKAGKAKQKAPLRAIDKSDHEESDSGEEEEQEDGEHVEERDGSAGGGE
ncbi:hypothetical protein NLI96_g9073 [Meripilus lineatus]|uniref:Uncharacterized protein n=1 Tax=Meripilus lineatus TaxID=2056292 RepID=A0AAD5V1E0_9APHY|nr:hypothetical protein NLI96_g9073 [Physisporinus lineatus]